MANSQKEFWIFQGEQIGQIFAFWAIIYFVQFLYCGSGQDLWTNLFHVKVVYMYILTKIGFGNILGDF
jgi:hypothetical protein